METYIMYGTYSEEALEQISPARTKQAIKIIEDLQGTVKGMYALLGAEDLMFITEFPNVKQAMKASVELLSATGIAFSTVHALPVEDFDTLMS